MKNKRTDILSSGMNDTVSLMRESRDLVDGHFLLSSGRHSDHYFQCAKLLEHPARAAAALSTMAEQLKSDIKAGKLQIDAVVGPAIGGIIIAYELGRQLGLPAFFTERDVSGVTTLRRRFEVKPGQNILIVDDVVITAKASRECAKVLEERGAKIAALACIVDFRSSNAKLPWPFYACCRLEANIWEAADCELCKKGVPIVKLIV